MIRKLRLLAALPLLFIIASAAAQQLPPAPFAPPPAGTELLMAGENGETPALLRITGNDGHWVSWTRGGKDHTAYSLFCWWCGDNIGFDKAKLESIWPLETGKQVSFDRSFGSRAWNDTVKVLGTETVEVPAGRFDVYVVETTSFSPRGWSGKRVHYYAPSLGWNVKIVLEASDTPRTVRHLLSVDGRSGIQATADPAPEAARFESRAIAFAGQPAPEPAALVPIGEVTEVRTLAYGTVPGASRERRESADTLTSNELLETVPGSALHAVFADDTDFRMGPAARVRLDRFVYDPDRGAGELAVSLGTGAFRLISGKVGNGIRVGTPDVVIAVRGTDFIVDVGLTQTVVTVLEGEVEVTPRTGGAPVSVAAGQTATATTDGASVAASAGDGVPEGLDAEDAAPVSVSPEGGYAGGG